MADNALVTWVETAHPWSAELQLIAAVNLQMHLDQNRHHGFHQHLSRTAPRPARRPRAPPTALS